MGRESKWDTPSFFFIPPRKAYVIVVFTRKPMLSRSHDLYLALPTILMGNLVFLFCFFFGSGGLRDRRRVRAFL